jgi:hypothetical protein
MVVLIRALLEYIKLMNATAKAVASIDTLRYTSSHAKVTSPDNMDGGVDGEFPAFGPCGRGWK